MLPRTGTCFRFPCRRLPLLSWDCGPGVHPGDLLGDSRTRTFFFGEAIRTASPVRDLCLIDLIAVVVVGGETRRLADCAVNVYHAAAYSADQVVMVVTNSILEARR